MKWLVCKAEFRFNKEHGISNYIPIECVQAFNTEKEADEAYFLFQRINYKFTYIVVSSDEIWELVR